MPDRRADTLRSRNLLGYAARRRSTLRVEGAHWSSGLTAPSALPHVRVAKLGSCTGRTSRAGHD